MTRKDNAGKAKIAVVGIGNVSWAFAFALSLKRLAGELVLVNANAAKAEGEAMDIMHGLPVAALRENARIGRNLSVIPLEYGAWIP